MHQTQGLTPEESVRYQRQTVLPEIGEDGQRKLLDSSVLVVGAGGLGSPVTLYLAAAGIGRIGIVDADVVDASNLHRQIVHPGRNIGMAKVDSAAETLAAVNPGCTVVRHRVLLTENNAESLLADYDIAVGCLDNFTARYILNQACINQGKANVFGSVSRFEGQAAVFALPGPCYQCFFQEPPPADHQPSLLDKGILGPVAGVIGSIQAIETIKCLLGCAGGLTGKLLLMDGYNASFRTLHVKPNLNCPACGTRRAKGTQ